MNYVKINNTNIIKTNENERTIFELYFKYSLPAKKPAAIIPKYTKEPNKPSSASLICKSIFISSVAAGKIPWSMFMNMFVIHIKKKTQKEPCFSSFSIDSINGYSICS